MGTRGLSDQSSLYLKLHVDSKCKNTLWRLNTSLLNYPGFKTTELQTYLENNNNGQVQTVTLWDTAKAVLRGTTISTTTFIKKAKEQRLIELQNKLLELEPPPLYWMAFKNYLRHESLYTQPDTQRHIL